MGVFTESRRIVLHTGFPKTGTTTAQNTFYAQRDFLLKKYYVLYPSLKPNLTDAMCTMFLTTPLNHITNRARGYSEEEVEKLALTYRSSLEDEINSADWNVLLISAEGLSNLNLNELKEVEKWLTQWTAKLSIHVYVRHPLDYSRSVMQQHLKGGETLVDMYRSPPLANFAARINNLHGAFGRKRVKIFSFEDIKKHPEGLSQGFLRNVNLNFTLLEPEQPVDNQSMSLQAALVLNSLNVQIPKFKDNKPNPKRSPGALKQIMQIRGEKFDIPLSVKVKIMNQARTDILSLNSLAGRTLYNFDGALDAVPEEKNSEQGSSINRDMIASLARILNDLSQ